MADFYKLMNDAGIKTSEEDIENKFLEMAEQEGIILYNKDEYSPFWSLIKSFSVASTRWLMVFVAENILPNRFLKTAKGEWLDLIGWGYREERQIAQKVIGHLTFTRFTNSGALSIKKDTVIQSLPVNGVIYELVVLNDTDFIDGKTFLDVECTAKIKGENFNLGGGLYVVLPESITGIASVKNSDGWIIQLGADLEGDDDFRLRLRDLWDGINIWHSDTSYRKIISKKANIETDNIYFNKNTGRGAGSADALILLDVGEMGEQLLADINYHITDEGNHGQGDDLRVINMPTIPIILNIDVYYSQVLTADQQETLFQQVDLYIRAAFRELSGNEFNNKPTQVKPFKRFSFSRLSGELHEEFTGLIDVDFNADSPVHGLNVSKIETLTLTGHGES